MPDPYGDHRDRRRRWTALTPELRQPLLEAAEKEFSEKGFENASFNAILKSAGRSKGQVYYYVRGKEDLYALMCEKVFERLVESVGPLEFGSETPESFWSSIEQFIARIVGCLMEDERAAKIGRGVYDSPRAEAAVDVSLDRLKCYLSGIAEIGQRAGAIRDDLPKDLIISTLMACLMAMDRWFAMNLPAYAPDEAQALSARALTMLRNLARPERGDDHA